MSSSSLTLYDVTIPLLVRSLEQLQAILKKGEQWAKDNNKDPQTLIDARIIDDMLPLPYQIQTCCNTAKNMLPRIGGEEAQPVEDNEKTFAEFAERIDATIKILRAAKKEKFVAPSQKVTVKSGPFLAQDIVCGCQVEEEIRETEPLNVCEGFHFGFEGVPVGKMDFLGASDITTWTL